MGLSLPISSRKKHFHPFWIKILIKFIYNAINIHNFVSGNHEHLLRSLQLPPRRDTDNAMITNFKTQLVIRIRNGFQTFIGQGFRFLEEKRRLYKQKEAEKRPIRNKK